MEKLGLAARPEAEAPILKLRSNNCSAWWLWRKNQRPGHCLLVLLGSVTGWCGMVPHHAMNLTVTRCPCSNSWHLWLIVESLMPEEAEAQAEAEVQAEAQRRLFQAW